MRRIFDIFRDSRISFPLLRSSHSGKDQTNGLSDRHLADHPALFSDVRSKSRLARFSKGRPSLLPCSYLDRNAPHLPSKSTLGKAVIVSELFLFSFLIGNLAAYVVTVRSGQGASLHMGPGSAPPSREAASYLNAPGSQTVLYASDEGNWGLSFQQEGRPPVANASMDYLKQFDGYYAQDTEDKVLYLTFDAGYENGNTAAILDALKKHNAPATFFLVGNYLETSPELVKRMVAEGHNVGNHTYHHPDMSKISTKETFSKELTALEALYEQVTGQPMKKYYRPPQGRYSEANLTMAKEMGYKTFFWSLAYVDWYEDKQPTKEEAFQKLLGRIHPGAIVLLHSTSKTNGEILDELLGKWEEMGYRFASLDALVDPADGQ